MNVVKLVPSQNPLRAYLIRLIDGRVLRVEAMSYILNHSNHYVFCMESEDNVWKKIGRGVGLSGVYEIHRRLVEAIEQEGCVQELSRSIRRRAGAKADRGK